MNDEEKPQGLRVRKSWNHARYGAPLWATCFRCTGTGRVRVTDEGAFRDEFVEYRAGDVPEGWSSLAAWHVPDPNTD